MGKKSNKKTKNFHNIKVIMLFVDEKENKEK